MPALGLTNGIAKKRRAVTLLETVLVLAIFGMIAVSGARLIGPKVYSQMRVDSEARTLRNTLRIARATAIVNRRETSVVFRWEDSRVTAYEVKSSGRTLPYIVHAVDSTVQLDGNQRLVSFQPDGSAKLAASFRIRTEEGELTVQVDQISGVASVVKSR